MEGLCAKERELVGWFDSLQHIYDFGLNGVAYVAGGHAWLVDTANRISPVAGLNCLDQAARVVAWNPRDGVAGVSRPALPTRPPRPARPARPARPSFPPRPARPPVPAGGWSVLSFASWLSQ